MRWSAGGWSNRKDPGLQVAGPLLSAATQPRPQLGRAAALRECGRRSAVGLKLEAHLAPGYVDCNLAADCRPGSPLSPPSGPPCPQCHSRNKVGIAKGTVTSV